MCVSFLAMLTSAATSISHLGLNLFVVPLA